MGSGRGQAKRVSRHWRYYLNYQLISTSSEAYSELASIIKNDSTLPWDLNQKQPFEDFVESMNRKSLSNYYLGSEAKISDEIMSYIVTELLRDIITKPLLYNKERNINNLLSYNLQNPGVLSDINKLNIKIQKIKEGYKIFFTYDDYKFTMDYIMDNGMTPQIHKSFKSPLSKDTFPFIILSNIIKNIKRTKQIT